jgi:hypothetical protein
LQEISRTVAFSRAEFWNLNLFFWRRLARQNVAERSLRVNCGFFVVHFPWCYREPVMLRARRQHSTNEASSSFGSRSGASLNRSGPFCHPATVSQCCPVVLDRVKFCVTASGHLWLSSTPTCLGSSDEGSEGWLSRSISNGPSFKGPVDYQHKFTDPLKHVCQDTGIVRRLRLVWTDSIPHAPSPPPSSSAVALLAPLFQLPQLWEKLSPCLLPFHP